ncbi:MAG: C25 family cysteine peptidase [candidate division Zixibacteria bacterium]|nr:C25 family cysteine peptidase [candidate division Zixibacteria bacterium]
MKHLICFGLVLLIVVGFCTNAVAVKSTFTVDFELSDLTFEKVNRFDQIQMKGGISFGEPGSPLLPIKVVQIAIPGDVEVDRAEIISSQHQEISGTYNIYPAQPPVPIGIQPIGLEKQEFVPPNSNIYELATEYPGELVKVTDNGFLAGQHIAGVLVYPLQYIPSKKKLILYTEIEFRLVFKPSSHYPSPVTVRSAKAANLYSDMVKKIVLNPDDLPIKAIGFLSKDQRVDFLIITADSFVSAFQQLADWKISQGISTEIKNVDWIFSTYAGVDSQEQIRNCIRDYYGNHGTMWVLLGGDTEIIPHRMGRTYQGHSSVPCELYYSDLDSNWDANNNRIYGEWADSVDMYPDIFVGRAPSSNVSEAQIFVTKSLTYETNPPDSHLGGILLCAQMQEGTNEYIDENFIPPFYEVTKLYCSFGNWDRGHFGIALNSGQNIINHYTHGSYDRYVLGTIDTPSTPDPCDDERWLNWDMDALVNGPNYSLLYSCACMTAGIDEDCIAEHFINNPNGGGFAYVRNSRYGIIGTSDGYDNEFFRLLFLNNIVQIGKTFATSKIPFIPFAKLWPWDRYVMFTLLLLGDPTLSIRPYHPDGPWIAYYSHKVSDSTGNNNGVANPGEPISMSITVKNVGLSTAHNVSATLKSSDSFVTITDSVKYFGNIDPLDTATSQGSYSFEVHPSCPDSHVVQFTLQVNGDSVWITKFTEMIVELDLLITAFPDSQRIRTGDSASFKLIFTPLGGFIWPVDLGFSELPQGVSGVFDPPQIIPPDTSFFTLHTTPDAELGTHVITVTASGASLVRQKGLKG